jgi:hypothetical protein
VLTPPQALEFHKGSISNQVFQGRIRQNNTSKTTPLNQGFEHEKNFLRYPSTAPISVADGISHAV